MIFSDKKYIKKIKIKVELCKLIPSNILIEFINNKIQRRVIGIEKFLKYNIRSVKENLISFNKKISFVNKIDKIIKPR